MQPTRASANPALRSRTLKDSMAFDTMHVSILRRASSWSPLKDLAGKLASFHSLFAASPSQPRYWSTLIPKK
jgi:hypothetical protein